MIQKLKLYTTFILLSLFVVACGGDSDDDTVPETCSDGIQNQDETGIDCGGVCDPCPSCSDGILNQGESGVDCGGPCPDCFSEKMTAKINGDDFAANLVAGFLDEGNIEFQSDQSQERQMFFVAPGTVTTGTYDLVNNVPFSALYGELFEGEYITETGTMEITAHNTDLNQLSGTFEFTAVQYDFGVPVDTVRVTEGIFSVEYFE